MERAENVRNELATLASASPAGFAIALHVTYTTPRFLFQTYPKEWMEEYSRRGFVLHDPTVKWGLENDGHIRWADLYDEDAAGVLKLAGEAGLKHGVTIATSDGGSKSVGSFARSDRAFSEDEISDLVGCLGRIHRATSEVPESSELEAELKRMSVQATHAGG